MVKNVCPSIVENVKKMLRIAEKVHILYIQRVRRRNTYVMLSIYIHIEQNALCHHMRVEVVEQDQLLSTA